MNAQRHSDSSAGKIKSGLRSLNIAGRVTSVKAKGFGAQEPAMTDPRDPEDYGFKPPMTARRETPPT